MDKEPKFRIGELAQSYKFINGYGLIVDRMSATNPGEAFVLDLTNPTDKHYYDVLSQHPSEWFYMVLGMHLYLPNTPNQDTITPPSMQLYLEENIQKPITLCVRPYEFKEKRKR